jgi:hypothetical protein
MLGGSCGCKNKPMSLRILPLLVLFSAMKGFSQEPIPPAKASKFRIGVNGSVEGVSRRQGWHYGTQEFETEAWNIKHIESGHGYTANIRLGYAIGPSTDLELGIGYILRSFVWNYSIIRFPSSPFPIQPIGLDGPGLPPSRRLHYLDVPVRLSHSVGKGRTRWISSVGVSIGFLSSHEPEPSINLRQHALFMRYPRSVNISPTISTGLAFFLSDRSDLRVEPTFMYGITPLTDHFVQTFMWSAGLNLGYFRRF